MMKQQKGNLIDLAEQGLFDAIVHGCNCFHAMGGGIAREIANRYPEAEASDDLTEYGSREKLGSFSYAVINRDDIPRFIIVNAYTQHRWSGFQDVFEYAAFDTFLNRLCPFLFAQRETPDQVIRVGFPKIGCGLARGDESKIIATLEKFSRDVSPWAEVTLVTR